MTIDPRSLAYDDHGEGIPVVVLLHGLTFDRDTWRPVSEQLGAGVRSIAFDLPGHGECGDELPRTLVEVADSRGARTARMRDYDCGRNASSESRQDR